MAAFVALTLAMPFPAVASGSCPMSSPVVSQERCDCCKTSDGPSRCAKPAPAAFRCGCSDTGSEPRQSQPSDASASALAHPFLTPALLPAAVAAPSLQCEGAPPIPPPDAYASTVRSLLCSWTI
ncbi:MAG TPA: hypothetical protein VEC57_11595 [Candidatus Limnocylindrales bacterium]|nr:hypothetical protein [Candidatus Limnocylindrales bacterium]